MPRIKSAAFSAIMITGEFVLPLVIVGITEASTTRRPAMPWTRSRSSTTARSGFQEAVVVEPLAEPVRKW